MVQIRLYLPMFKFWHFLTNEGGNSAKFCYKKESSRQSVSHGFWMRYVQSQDLCSCDPFTIKTHAHTKGLSVVDLSRSWSCCLVQWLLETWKSPTKRRSYFHWKGKTHWEISISFHFGIYTISWMMQKLLVYADWLNQTPRKIGNGNVSVESYLICPKPFNV